MGMKRARGQQNPSWVFLKQLSAFYHMHSPRLRLLNSIFGRLICHFSPDPLDEEIAYVYTQTCHIYR